MSEHRVAALEDVREGAGVVVDIGDKRLAIFLHDGRYFAIDETCPHRGAPLHEGTIDRGILVCPWHAWQFELESGCSPVNALSKVGTYPIRTVGESLFVEL